MGVDVVFKARPLNTDQFDQFDQFDRVRARFRARFPDSNPSGGHHFPDLVWDESEPEPTLEVRSLDRYYGPGYERGHWPDIKTMGDWLADELGEDVELRYGGDSADEWGFLREWRTVSAEVQRHWEEFGNEPYHNAFTHVDTRLGMSEPSEPTTGPMTDARLEDIRDLWLDEDAYYAVRELLAEVDRLRADLESAEVEIETRGETIDRLRAENDEQRVRIIALYSRLRED